MMRLACKDILTLDHVSQEVDTQVPNGMISSLQFSNAEQFLGIEFNPALTCRNVIVLRPLTDLPVAQHCYDILFGLLAAIRLRLLKCGDLESSDVLADGVIDHLSDLSLRDLESCILTSETNVGLPKKLKSIVVFDRSLGQGFHWARELDTLPAKVLNVSLALA